MDGLSSDMDKTTLGGDQTKLDFEINMTLTAKVKLLNLAKIVITLLL